MPRFQSVDYYQRKLLRTRELYTNASLTVPCHFNDSGNPSEAPSKTRSLHELLSDLKEEDVEDFAEEPDFYLNGSRIKDGEWSVEQLDWLTAWRELEGHYVEIVPSSNPESHSSFIDDAPITGSLAEFCYVEDFMPQPLETLCQGERWMLEEPIKVCVESQNDPDSPTTSIKSCLDQATVIDSENPISVDQQISETTVFGTGDQQLDVDNEAEPCMLKDMMTGKSFHEEEELHEFQETRGEELLSPVCHHQSPPPSSPVESHLLSSLLEQSKSVCAQLSTSLAIPDCKEKGPELPDTSEVFEGWSDERPRLQGLLLSPTVQEDVTSFVAINEAYKDGSPVTQHEQNVLEKCELESPMECCEIASPVCLADKCKAEAVNLTEWSPDVLTSHSPFLSNVENAKLEKYLLHKEHGFDSIQALKLQEPDVVQEKEATTAGKPIEKALHLAVSHDTNASFGQLELNLSWNLSPAVPLLSLSIPEALQFSGDETQQPLPAFDPRDLSCCFESETSESDTQDESPRMLQRLLTDTSKRARVVAESKSEKSSEQIRQEHRVAAFKKDQSWSSTEEKSKATHFGSTQRGHPFEKFIMKNDVPLDVQSPSKFNAQKGLIAAGGQRSHVGPVTSHVTSARPTAATRSAANRTFDNLDSPLTITEAKRAALVSTTNGDNQLNSTDNCADRESLSQEGNVPFDAFDLQFDEDEIVLDSDSLEEKGSQALSEKSLQATREVPSPFFDPVDSFVMLREAKASRTFTQAAVEEHTVVKPVPRVKTSGVVTPMSVIPRSLTDMQQTPAYQRLVSVTLSGEFAKASQKIECQAEPLLQRLKARSLLSPDVTFSSLTPDVTRFMLRDRAAKLLVIEKDTEMVVIRVSLLITENSTDEVYQALLLLHALCSASDLLQNCCLESAIVYLGAIQDNYTWLSGNLDGVRKELFTIQFTAQQAGELHPKVAAVCREIQQMKQLTLKQELSGTKLHCLVVVRRDQPTLMKTLQSAIAVDGTRTKIIHANEDHDKWPEDYGCLITWDQAVVSRLLRHSRLVVEFEAGKASPLLHSCSQSNVDYVGLCVGSDSGRQQSDQMLVWNVNGEIDTGDDCHLTVIGSQELIKHQGLLHLLETRHNIVVMVRDYKTVGKVHYADILVDTERGAVLLDVNQLKETGALERVTERMASGGLHLSLVWILLYRTGGKSGTRDMCSTEVVKKAVHLQALMANLSTASEGFSVSYKVIFCKSSNDVASYVHHLATLHAGESNRGGLSRKVEDCIFSHEMSQEEKFLLGIPCLNSASAQLLLSKATLGQLMVMSEEDLQALASELPSTIIKNLYKVFSMDTGLRLHLDSSTISDNSSCSHRDNCTSTSQRTPSVNGSDLVSPKFCRQEGPESKGGNLSTQPSLVEQTGIAYFQNLDDSLMKFKNFPPLPVVLDQDEELLDSADLLSHQLHFPRPHSLHNRLSPDVPDSLQNPRVQSADFRKEREVIARNQTQWRNPETRMLQNLHISRFQGSEQYDVEQSNTRHVCPTSNFLDNSQSFNSGLGKGPTSMPDHRRNLRERGEHDVFPQQQDVGCKLHNSKYRGTVSRHDQENYLSPTRNTSPSASQHFSQMDANSCGREFSFNTDIGGTRNPLLPSRKKLRTSRAESYEMDDSFSRMISKKQITSDREIDTSSSLSPQKHQVSAQKGICDKMHSYSQADFPLSTCGRFDFHQSDTAAKLQNQHDNPTPFRSRLWQGNSPLRMGGSHSHWYIPSSDSGHGHYQVRQYQPQTTDSADKWHSHQLRSGLPEHSMNLANRGDTNRVPRQATDWSRGIYGPFSDQLAATTRRLLQGQTTGFTTYQGPHHRTPHRISIGLAQPLRRETTQESNKAGLNVAQHSREYSEGQLLTDSPPMDTDWDCGTDENQIKGHISTEKLRKWWLQLQSQPSLTGSVADMNTSSQKMSSLDQRGRRLTYQPVSGSGGQTKLTFS